jgi:hypothetical protein
MLGLWFMVQKNIKNVKKKTNKKKVGKMNLKSGI